VLRGFSHSDIWDSQHNVPLVCSCISDDIHNLTFVSSSSTTTTDNNNNNNKNKDNSPSHYVLNTDHVNQDHVNSDKFKEGDVVRKFFSTMRYVKSIHDYNELKRQHVGVRNKLYYGNEYDPDRQTLVTVNQYLEQLQSLHESRLDEDKLLPQIKTQDPLLYLSLKFARYDGEPVLR